MVLLIDNYDSFTYNLYQYIGQFDSDISVIRNDKASVEEIRTFAPERIIISPGPGTPDDAGICIEVIRQLGADIPILGVCLGHQCIGRAFGGSVSYAKQLFHGKYSMLRHSESVVFKDMPQPFKAARYHSLSVMAEDLPSCLRVTAQDESGEIMAMEHREYSIYGLQFHPESIYTPDGMTIIRNFMQLKG